MWSVSSYSSSASRVPLTRDERRALDGVRTYRAWSTCTDSTGTSVKVEDKVDLKIAYLKNLAILAIARLHASRYPYTPCILSSEYKLTDLELSYSSSYSSDEKQQRLRKILETIAYVISNKISIPQGSDLFGGYEKYMETLEEAVGLLGDFESVQVRLPTSRYFPTMPDLTEETEADDHKGETERLSGETLSPGGHKSTWLSIIYHACRNIRSRNPHRREEKVSCDEEGRSWQCFK